MLLPEVRYEGAGGISKGHFEHLHEVPRSQLDGLVEGVKTSRLDADALPGLAVHMESCKSVLEQVEHTADLNSLDMFEQIVKWARKVDKLTEREGNEV